MIIIIINIAFESAKLLHIPANVLYTYTCICICLNYFFYFRFLLSIVQPANTALAEYARPLMSS